MVICISLNTQIFVQQRRAILGGNSRQHGQRCICKFPSTILIWVPVFQPLWSSRQQILPMLPCRISCPGDSVSDRVPATWEDAEVDFGLTVLNGLWMSIGCLPISARRKLLFKDSRTSACLELHYSSTLDWSLVFFIKLNSSDVTLHPKRYFVCC